MQHIVDGGCFFVGMTVEAAGLQVVCDHLLYGSELTAVVGVDATGRGVAGTANAAFGRDIMQGLDVVKAVKGAMTFTTRRAWRFLGQVGGEIDVNGVGCVPADSAVDVAIEISRMTA